MIRGRSAVVTAKGCRIAPYCGGGRRVLGRRAHGRRERSRSARREAPKGRWKMCRRTSRDRRPDWNEKRYFVFLMDTTCTSVFGSM